MFSTAEAQFLKKLKQKAEEAAERTILRKTDEVVTEKTEKTIDDATTPKDKSDEKTEDTKKVAKKGDTKKANNNNNEQATSKNLEADIHVQNSVQPEVTQIGGSVTFTIATNNKGPATSQDIVSKIIIPNSYAITNMSVSQGAYNETSRLWNVGTLEAWKRAVMTVTVTVLNDANLMTTAELISCNTTDPDSTPNNGIDTNGNGLIVDDRDDEDDGDGQDVKISDTISDNNNNEDENANHDDSNGEESENQDYDDETNPNNDGDYYYSTDVKMVMEHKKDKIIAYLDFDTMAMRLEDHSKGKKNDPIYWDKDGYIYSGEKGNYYKIPFEQVKNMGKSIGNMFSKGIDFMPGVGLPKVNGEAVDLEFPNKPIFYNGYELHVYPNRYPMVEWIFIYHPKVFRGADNIREEIVSFRGTSNCSKFTVINGKDAGSYILFLPEGYLAEIYTPNNGTAVYTYEPATVTLPTAQEFNFKN
jgi:uncharacterized repeat protein (TIGR01451 family)